MSSKKSEEKKRRNRPTRAELLKMAGLSDAKGPRNELGEYQFMSDRYRQQQVPLVVGAGTGTATATGTQATGYYTTAAGAKTNYPVVGASTPDGGVVVPSAVYNRAPPLTSYLAYLTQKANYEEEMKAKAKAWREYYGETSSGEVEDEKLKKERVFDERRQIRAKIESVANGVAQEEAPPFLDPAMAFPTIEQISISLRSAKPDKYIGRPGLLEADIDKVMKEIFKDPDMAKSFTFPSLASARAMIAPYKQGPYPNYAPSAEAAARMAAYGALPAPASATRFTPYDGYPAGMDPFGAPN